MGSLAAQHLFDDGGCGGGGAGVVRECGANGGGIWGVWVGFERGGCLVARFGEVVAQCVEAHLLGEVHRFTPEAAPVGFVGGWGGGELDAGGEFEVGGGEPGEFVAERPAVSRGGGGESGFREGFE